MDKPKPEFRVGCYNAEWWPIPISTTNASETAEQSSSTRVFIPPYVVSLSSEKILYHYTSINSFHSIIESNTIWVSHIRYMNDVAEYFHGRDLAITTLNRCAEKLRFADFRRILKQTSDLLSAMAVQDYYVASFSRKSDDLSQWRAYGKDGGVCIGFSAFEREHIGHFWLSQRAIYGAYEKTAVMLFYILKYYEEFKKDREYNGGVYPEFLWSAYSDSLAKKLDREFIRFKHESFQSEQEIRYVISAGEEQNFQPRSFRVQGNLIIPYYKTSDRILRKDGVILAPPKLPILSITVGPTTNQDLCAKSISDFLDFHGYDSSLVKTSKLPYRTH